MDETEEQEETFTEDQVQSIITGAVRSVIKKVVIFALIDAIVGATTGILLANLTSIPAWAAVLIAVLIWSK